MTPQWLVCPQCGAPLFFVDDGRGTRLYFHVGIERDVLPTKPEYERARALAGGEIRCTGCSWRGPRARLRERV
jgi:hypothetical protein